MSDEERPGRVTKISAVHTRLYALDGKGGLWLRVYGRWSRVPAPTNMLGEEERITAFTVSYVPDDARDGFTVYVLLFDCRLFESWQYGVWNEIK